MKAASILLVIGCVFILSACAIVTARVAGPNDTTKIQGKPQMVVQTKENVNAEPALSVNKNTSACPATRAIEPVFVPPTPYPAVAPYGDFWYGTARLWTALIPGGKWDALPNDGTGYSQKIFWWSRRYEAATEPAPDLKVTGRQLDGDATFTGMGATNAFHRDFGGWAMLTGVNIPRQGCWEITGEYAGETLIFVVHVGN